LSDYRDTDIHSKHKLRVKDKVMMRTKQVNSRTN